MNFRRFYLIYLSCICIINGLFLCFSVSAAPSKGEKAAKAKITSSPFDGVYTHEIDRPDLETFEQVYTVKGNSFTGQCGPYRVQGKIDLKPDVTVVSFEGKAFKVVKVDGREVASKDDIGIFNGAITLYDDGSAEFVVNQYNRSQLSGVFLTPIGIRQKKQTGENDDLKSVIIFIEGFKYNPTGKDTEVVLNYKNAVFGDAQYYYWEDTQKIISYIESLPQSVGISLVGHSYGGDTAVQVAGISKRKIDILITIDPVSRVTSSDPKNRETEEEYRLRKIKAARDNVKAWINVQADYKSMDEPPDNSDKIAEIGGKWNRTPYNFVNGFASPPYHHRQFAEMMRVNIEDGISCESALKDFVK